MKRFLLPCILLLISLTMGHAQTVINISGTVHDLSTASGSPNQTVTVNLIDSLTLVVLMTASTNTDSLGDYAISLTTANMPTSGLGEVSVVDCNGSKHQLLFRYSASVNPFSNFDFYICSLSPACNPAFIAQQVPGQTVVNFTDQSTAAAGTVIWWMYAFGDGDTAYTANPTHTYAAPGVYNVCLTITTSTSCSTTLCYTVSVGLGASNCQTTLNYGTLPNSGAMGFWATTSSTGTPIRFDFDFGDGNSLTAVNGIAPYTYPNGGIFTACVDVLFSDSCYTSQSCTQVNANSNVSCQADFAAIPDTSGQFSILVINNCLGNNLQYTWQFGDGDSSHLAYPQHTYAGPGTYYMCVSVQDSPMTCSASFCDSIVVINKIDAPFSIQVVEPLGTGSEPAASEMPQVSLYPNPANSEFTMSLSLTHATSVRMELTDLQGRVLKQQNCGTLSTGRHAIQTDVQGLSAGIYLVRMQQGDRQVVKKLVLSGN